MNVVFLMEADRDVVKLVVGVAFGAEIAWDDEASLVRSYASLDSLV